MKYAAKAVVTATALATAGQSQVISTRAKLNTLDDSASESHREGLNRLRDLQKEAGIASMSYPMEDTIGTLSDAATMNKISKSGKSGPNIPQTNYGWVSGEYEKCTNTQISLFNGEPYRVTEDGDCSDLVFFSVTPLRGSNRMFNATLIEPVPCVLFGLGGAECPNSTGVLGTDTRIVHEAVGSYNPLFRNQITFFADHQEYRKTDTVSGDDVWVPYGSPGSDDVSTMTCSKLEDFPYGETIVCDVFESTSLSVGNFSHGSEIIGTFFFSEE